MSDVGYKICMFFILHKLGFFASKIYWTSLLYFGFQILVRVTVRINSCFCTCRNHGLATMAAVSSTTLPTKLFRCGVCTNDFPSLNACVAHIKTHAAEPDLSSKTAASAAHTVQLQLQSSEPCSLGRKHPNNVSTPTSGPSVCDKLGSFPAVTQSSSINRAPSLQGSSHHIRRAVTASALPESCSRQKSILVQTDICGTVSVKTESSACAEQSPVRKVTASELSSCAASESSSCASAKQGPVRKAVDASIKPMKVEDAAESRPIQDPQQGASSEGLDASETESDRSFGCEDSEVKAEDKSHNAKVDKEAGEFNNELEDSSHVVDIDKVKEAEGGFKKPGVTSLRRKASVKEDRPYACSECSCRYRFLSSLSVHKKRHFGSQPYQ